MTTISSPEAFAARLLTQAVNEGRAAELLDVLHGGGAATIDQDGRLLLVTGEQLADVMTPWEDSAPAPVLVVTLDDDIDFPYLGDVKDQVVIWNPTDAPAVHQSWMRATAEPDAQRAPDDE